MCQVFLSSRPEVCERSGAEGDLLRVEITSGCEHGVNRLALVVDGGLLAADWEAILVV